MPQHKMIDRHERLTADLNEALAKYRDSVERAAELLKRPPPDTFWGRQTSEPFPKEDE